MPERTDCTAAQAVRKFKKMMKHSRKATADAERLFLLGYGGRNVVRLETIVIIGNVRFAEPDFELIIVFYVACSSKCTVIAEVPYFIPFNVGHRSLCKAAVFNNVADAALGGDFYDTFPVRGFEVLRGCIFVRKLGRKLLNAVRIISTDEKGLFVIFKQSVMNQITPAEKNIALHVFIVAVPRNKVCLLYTSPSPRDS